jgi:PKHD-type hydroxylase
MRGNCYVANDPILTKQECSNLIDRLSEKVSTARLGARTVDTSYRSTKSCAIKESECPELYSKIESYCLDRNNEFWNFELEGQDPIQFLLYEVGDNYKWHLDIGKGKHSTRKLSIVIPLSSGESYEGGELLVKIAEKDISVPLKQGCPILFPSYILHKVTPVTKGKRFMLVGWMKGETPFR